jgi:hypothetical protein
LRMWMNWLAGVDSFVLVNYVHYIYIIDTCFDTHMHIHFIMGIGL